MNAGTKYAFVTVVCDYCGHEEEMRYYKNQDPKGTVIWKVCPKCGRAEMMVKESTE